MACDFVFGEDSHQCLSADEREADVCERGVKSCKEEEYMYTVNGQYTRERTILYLVASVLLTWAVTQQSHAADAVTGKFIFEYCHSNAAWGHTLNGFFIDAEGSVWKYDHGGDSWTPSRADGLFYEFDLTEKYRDAKQVGTVDKAVLSAMISLIDAASQAELKRRNAGNDMGSLSYMAYLYDPVADSYKEVILSSKGDWIIENTSGAAKTLTQWLESVFFRQPPRSEQAGSPQAPSRGKIRAVNPEIKVIQKIPAPAPEIRVEQKGPFPIEER
jgi:hypothetical protein